jgi:hypothetical protein
MSGGLRVLWSGRTIGLTERAANAHVIDVPTANGGHGPNRIHSAQRVHSYRYHLALAAARCDDLVFTRSTPPQQEGC